MHKSPQTLFCESLYQATRDNVSAQGITIPPLSTRKVKRGRQPIFEVLAKMADSAGAKKPCPIWNGYASCAADAKTRAIEALYLPETDNPQGSLEL